ncbi:hypothetical protein LXL04_024131 [Taraxacum kok-saghyz]
MSGTHRSKSKPVRGSTTSARSRLQFVVNSSFAIALFSLTLSLNRLMFGSRIEGISTTWNSCFEECKALLVPTQCNCNIGSSQRKRYAILNFYFSALYIHGIDDGSHTRNVSLFKKIRVLSLVKKSTSISIQEVPMLYWLLPKGF